MSSVRF